MAISATARISSSRVDRAEIGRLGQIDRGRLAAMQLARRKRGERARQRVGIDLAVPPATGTSLRPPPKNPAALASEVLMCAAALQKTSPQEGAIAARDSALAAVPVATGNTRTVVSNSSENRSCSRAVHSSAP